MIQFWSTLIHGFYISAAIFSLREIPQGGKYIKFKYFILCGRITLKEVLVLVSWSSKFHIDCMKWWHLIIHPFIKGRERQIRKIQVITMFAYVFILQGQKATGIFCDVFKSLRILLRYCKVVVRNISVWCQSFSYLSNFIKVNSIF